MENASKALIIAGAILLAISIIGIGMYVFNMASESMSGVGLDAEEIAAYNSKFDKYEGTQKGSAVRTLCTTILNHNLANSDDESKQVTLMSSSASTVNDFSSIKTESEDKARSAAYINKIKSGVQAGKTYTVDFGYDKNSGMIIAVGFKEKTSKEE